MKKSVLILTIASACFCAAAAAQSGGGYPSSQNQTTARDPYSPPKSGAAPAFGGTGLRMPGYGSAGSAGPADSGASGIGGSGHGYDYGDSASRYGSDQPGPAGDLSRDPGYTYTPSTKSERGLGGPRLP